MKIPQVCPLLDSVDVIRGESAPRVVAPHHHERYAIAVATAGSHRIQYRESNFLVNPGDALVISPREIHGATPVSDRGWSYEMVYVGEACVHSVADDLRGRSAYKSPPNTPVVSDPALRRAISRVCARVRDGSALLLDEQINGMIEALVRCRMIGSARHFGPAYESRAVREAESYLRAHFHQEVRLANLAALVGLNPTYLVYAFRRAIGVSPHRYQDQVRIARAQELISQGMSLSHVAASVGYCDQSHLTRQFKKLIGITPGAYRLINAGSFVAKGGGRSSRPRQVWTQPD